MKTTSPLVAALALLLAGCRPAPQPTPLAELNPQQSRGHAVYEVHCAVCHYERKDAVLHGPALVSLFKIPTLPSGAAATDERVTAVILRGRNQMPPMRRQISDDDLADLLAYLHTL